MPVKWLRVMGIDPGSRRTGFGVVDYLPPRRTRYVASGIISITDKSLGPALSTLFEGVRELVTLYRPEQVAVEKVFLSRNPQSALKLGQARGAAIAAAMTFGISLAEYSATQVKMTVVGKGNAKKNQVQHMVQSMLQLPATPSTDAADALACALCHCHYQSGWYARVQVKASS